MYKINPKILQTETLEGQMLLLEPQAGLYFELNETSVLIYQGLMSGLDEKAIVNGMVSSYEIDHEQASVDVSFLIDELIEKNIVISINKH
jgi:uncharacterized protein YihD (DUF1040 family)